MPHFNEHDRPVTEDDEDDGWDDENNDVVYLKFMFEGAASITELSAALRGFADELDRQASAGWRLAGPVDGGWAHLTREAAG